MNQEIIEMGKEAKFFHPDLLVKELTAFAKLVAAKEREACAKVCDKYADVLDPLRPKGKAADYFQGGVKSASRRNAAAIRAGVEA
jgi:hypothetical protein